MEPTAESVAFFAWLDQTWQYIALTCAGVWMLWQMRNPIKAILSPWAHAPGSRGRIYQTLERLEGKLDEAITQSTDNAEALKNHEIECDHRGKRIDEALARIETNAKDHDKKFTEFVKGISEWQQETGERIAAVETAVETKLSRGRK